MEPFLLLSATSEGRAAPLLQTSRQQKATPYPLPHSHAMAADAAKQRKQADEQHVRDAPPTDVAFSFERYSGTQLNLLNGFYKGARKRCSTAHRW